MSVYPQKKNCTWDVQLEKEYKRWSPKVGWKTWNGFLLWKEEQKKALVPVIPILPPSVNVVFPSICPVVSLQDSLSKLDCVDCCVTPVESSYLEMLSDVVSHGPEIGVTGGSTTYELPDPQADCNTPRSDDMLSFSLKLDNIIPYDLSLAPSQVELKMSVGNAEMSFKRETLGDLTNVSLNTVSLSSSFKCSGCEKNVDLNRYDAAELFPGSSGRCVDCNQLPYVRSAYIVPPRHHDYGDVERYRVASLTPQWKPLVGPGIPHFSHRNWRVNGTFLQIVEPELVKDGLIPVWRWLRFKFFSMPRFVDDYQPYRILVVRLNMETHTDFDVWTSVFERNIRADMLSFVYESDVVHVLYDAMWNLSSSKTMPWGKGRNQYIINVPIADVSGRVKSDGRIVLLICSDWYRDSVKLQLDIKGSFDYVPSTLSKIVYPLKEVGEYDNKPIYFTALPISIHLCNCPDFEPDQFVFSYFLHGIAEQEVPLSYFLLLIDVGDDMELSKIETSFLNEQVVIGDQDYLGIHVLESCASDYTRPFTISAVNLVYDIPKRFYPNFRMLLTLRTHVSSQCDGGVQYAYKWRKKGVDCPRAILATGAMLPRTQGVCKSELGEIYSRPYYI